MSEPLFKKIGSKFHEVDNGSMSLEHILPSKDKLTAEELHVLSHHSTPYIRYGVVFHPNTSKETLKKFVKDKSNNKR